MKKLETIFEKHLLKMDALSEKQCPNLKTEMNSVKNILKEIGLWRFSEDYFSFSFDVRNGYIIDGRCAVYGPDSVNQGVLLHSGQLGLA